MLELSKKQALLLKSVFKQIPPVGDFYTKEYSFTSDSRDIYAAALSNIGDDLNLCVSLPRNSSRAFLCISDADDSELGKVVASLQRYHETKSPIGLGDTVPLTTNEYVINHNWYAALILSVDTLVDGFDISFKQDCPDWDVLLVCFITNSEYTKKIKYGLNALLDVFEKNERDLVGFYRLKQSGHARNS
ncbi:MAG TPA: hypothetical protein VKA50_12565 [Gammaproteobacteria bacterium]|nr:hypothetical protein [Gammaproteobacteria bacterium]